MNAVSKGQMAVLGPLHLEIRRRFKCRRVAVGGGRNLSVSSTASGIFAGSFRSRSRTAGLENTSLIRLAMAEVVL